MKKKWSSCILDFYANTVLATELPAGVEALYPYRDDPHIRRMVKAFYTKYYSDKQSRRLILGINPGRLGAGATGIPFTDTKRLEQVCGIAFEHAPTHEPSSVLVYDVIAAYGGPELFYNDFYISSICPIGFVQRLGTRAVNFNYYDDAAFAEHLMPELAVLLQQQMEWGIRKEQVIVFGTGQNLKFFETLNARYRLFAEVIALEHPRYIMQYKQREKMAYIDKYLTVLRSGF